MRDWIIVYQDQNGNSNKARVTTEKYGMALNRAEEVIKQLNNIYKLKELETVLTVVSIDSLEGYEDWTNI